MRLQKLCVFALLVALLAVLPGISTIAQDDSCPTLVETALANIGDDCADMGRNEACYGYNRVDVTFWEERDDISFSLPADRASLLDLQTIATAPLNLDDQLWGIAVLNVQANVPNTMPGQAVTFLLMGDATLENDVVPEDISGTVIPVDAVTNSGANLRSLPTTNANVVGGLQAGDELSLVGVNDTGDWYEITLDDGGSAWIYGTLVDVGETSDLPVTYGENVGPRYGPMQAFYFTSGVGSSGCNEAPNALVIRNPQGAEVMLRINELDVIIGSTIVLTTSQIEEQAVMIISLVEGHVAAKSPTILVNLKQPGATVAVTLNDEGRVDSNSQAVEFDSEEFAGIIRNACQNASQMGVFQGKALQGCDVELTDAGTGSSPAGGGGACTVTAFNTINLRGGPGTDYSIAGTLSIGTGTRPESRVTVADGYVWWELPGGSWVRDDLVDMAGDCDSLGSPKGIVHQGNISLNLNYDCSSGFFIAKVNSTITINQGYGYGTQQFAQQNNGQQITINGQPMPITLTSAEYGEGCECWNVLSEYIWTPTEPGVYTVIGSANYFNFGGVHQNVCAVEIVEE